MTKTTGAASAAATILAVLLYSGAAGAVTRTWVSGSGDDSNPCTRDFPCATFAQAYNLTDAGGEIDVVDGGDFGVLQISKSIIIANDGAGVAAIAPSSSGDVPIGLGLASTDTVVLRGLTVNGINSTNFGISTTGAGSLLIDHCKIQNFRDNPGLVVAPSGISSMTVWVKDTTFVNNGASSLGSIWIAPGNQQSAMLHLDRVHILNSTGNAIRADGTFHGGTIGVELHDVTVDGSSGGSSIVAVAPTSGGPTVTIFADEVTVSHSAGYGARAVGGTASITLSRSVIQDNNTGIGVSSGGRIFSYRDNRFSGNTAGDGVAPDPAPLK
jgi:hypothetical protein